MTLMYELKTDVHLWLAEHLSNDNYKDESWNMDQYIWFLSVREVVQFVFTSNETMKLPYRNGAILVTWPIFYINMWLVREVSSFLVYNVIISYTFSCIISVRQSSLPVGYGNHGMWSRRGSHRLYLNTRERPPPLSRMRGKYWKEEIHYLIEVGEFKAISKIAKLTDQSFHRIQSHVSKISEISVFSAAYWRPLAEQARFTIRTILLLA